MLAAKEVVSAGILPAVPAVVAGTASVEAPLLALPPQGVQKPPRWAGQNRFLGLLLATPEVAGKALTPGGR